MKEKEGPKSKETIADLRSIAESLTEKFKNLRGYL